MVHEDITDNFSWISSGKRGLQTIPTSGWQYWDESTGTWHDDPDLKFIYNKNVVPPNRGPNSPPG